MNQVPSALLRTPLYDWHAAHNGRLVEFGGNGLIQKSGVPFFVASFSFGDSA